MKENGEEGITGIYWPTEHQEDCFSSVYVRVLNMEVFGGGPEFQSWFCRERNESKKWG